MRNEGNAIMPYGNCIDVTIPADIFQEVNNMSDNLENLPNNEENNEDVMKIEIDSITEENENGEVVEILDKEQKKKNSLVKEIFDWVVSIASAIAIVLLLHIFVFVQVTVSGSSMDPTLKDKDRLIAVRFMYEPRYSDIVVVDPYLKEGTVKGKTMFNRVLYIKRVIATGGQTIDLRDGKVYIDGKLLEEDYIADFKDYILTCVVKPCYRILVIGKQFIKFVYRFYRNYKVIAEAVTLVALIFYLCFSCALCELEAVAAHEHHCILSDNEISSVKDGSLVINSHSIGGL